MSVGTIENQSQANCCENPDPRYDSVMHGQELVEFKMCSSCWSVL